MSVSENGTPHTSPARKKIKLEEEEGGDSKDIDEEFYTRQLHVLGQEAMLKLGSSNILICGPGGLGVEVAENVILTGVRSVTLWDTVACQWSHLPSQLYLTEEDIRKNRAEASLPNLALLNSHVQVAASSQELTKEFLKTFQVVVLTDSPLEEQLKVSKIVRSYGNALIVTKTRGLFGKIFNDFGPNFTFSDTNGENPKSAMIAQVSRDENGLVTCLDEVRHGLETGDCVTFTEVEGMTDLNGCEPRPVKVVDPYSFTIGDTSRFSYYVRGGTVIQVKQPITFHFKPLEQALDEPEFLPLDWSRPDRPAQIHLAFITEDEFKKRNPKGRSPQPWAREDSKLFVEIAEEINNRTVEGPAKVEFVDDDLLATFCREVAGPLDAIIGGIVALEVVKAASGKFSPIFQFLYLDATECLPVDHSILTEERSNSSGTLADPGGRQEGDCLPFAGKINMGRIGLAPPERYRKFHLTHVKRPPSDQGLDPPMIRNTLRQTAELKDDNEFVLVIDFGTSNCRLNIWPLNVVYSIPSFAVLLDEDVCFTGLAAQDWIEQGLVDPDQIITGIKSLVGRKVTDPSVIILRNYCPFNVAEGHKTGRKAMIKIEIEGEKILVSPEKIVLQWMKDLKESAEEEVKEPITKAVITVPASFNNSQRQAIRTAAIEAGLNGVDVNNPQLLINKPSAYAMSYASRMDEEGPEEENLLVFCLGGGFFDASVVTAYSSGKVSVKATNGKILGGNEFDNILVDYFIAELLKRKSPQSLPTLARHDLRKLAPLRIACQLAKEQLSKELEATINVPSLLKKADGSLEDFQSTITRSTFEYINLHLFKSTIVMALEAIKAARMGIDDIAKVFLVGGSCRIVKIRKLLKKIFVKKNMIFMDKESVCVANGASKLVERIKEGEDPLDDVISFSIGASTPNHTNMICLKKRNSSLASSHLPPLPTLYECRGDDLKNDLIFTIREGSHLNPKRNKKLGTITVHRPDSVIPEASGVAVRRYALRVSVDRDGILKDVLLNKCLRDGEEEEAMFENITYEFIDSELDGSLKNLFGPDQDDHNDQDADMED